MPLSIDIANKSVQASIAAIEIYNKPNFSYREEAFTLLMSNAWELLLKAKWIADHGESIEALHEFVDDGNGNKTPKTNRCGNPLSHSATYLAKKLLEDPNSGLEKACHDNMLALIEIRDSAAHFIMKDMYIGRRVLEIGTASLRNYLLLAAEWFQLDLSEYNFFLMPISFYHGFETVEPASRVHYPEQIRNLLAYLDTLENAESEEDSNQHVALRLETKLVRGKDACSVMFRWTDDPSAPALTVREEDILKNYPLTYRELVNAMRRRYENFLENRTFHKQRHELEKETKHVIVRLLHPNNPKSAKQRFYNPNIFQEFDKRYVRRKKA
ncbi:uncharacterized protein DUF3644 [Plasticicumulans lactativorans]|uniref:Uncharacterized protein DUF3644 n=1 Tax=Plasticicumulans lactativorans TaxID=1133106 RepID=A0A4R2LD60_9GAMM|nr:DUF3644 domain-containing protein [Plasticicumulans lactativorans]TCO82376.1 uncharacterized protein DUF3644 [Plasticicumulans lactativorans]